MPPVEHAVIAAAGFGSRLGFGFPKCLVEVHGRPILAHQLDLLRDVPDVRLVVGFEEDRVRALASSLRPDVIIVRNPAFATTSTLQSYAMGARHLQAPCLFMDADILFDPASFHRFLERAASVCPLIGYTPAKTIDAVYAHVTGDEITGFSTVRGQARPASRWEWANLAYLPPQYCEGRGGPVFELLAETLPLPAQQVQSWEVDRLDDLARAEAEYADPRASKPAAKPAA